MLQDVAVIGGGPAGSTLAGFIKKYRPDSRVLILEREKFPRDHVGESQLPLISRILNELGVWEKVEEAGFPIKVGATYRWGNTDDLWDFHFVPGGLLKEQPRPAEFSGQRTQTAFQVDRARFDKILLDHARELGVEVREEKAVREVLRKGDAVSGLRLADGSVLEAGKYVDASGHSGILRRAMGVEVKEPSNLQNVAIWDYWRNAEWAVKIGVGGTRVQVMSLPYGWIWFIPLGPDRTSIGLVCPAEYYKRAGLDREKLYMKAVADEPHIRSLVSAATRENKLSSTKDWSFLAQRAYGANWALVGEALGFADPILAAGMTLAHASAKECAFTILEELRGRDANWLWPLYEEKNKRRIRQHIRFADYWYTANANFSELKEFTREIARDAGLELDADKAFQWLGTGGFVEEDMGIGGLGTVGMHALHQIANRMSETPTFPEVNGQNNFQLLAEGAKLFKNARYAEGRVEPVDAVRRDGKVLPLSGFFGMIIDGLQKSTRADDLTAFVESACHKTGLGFAGNARVAFLGCLEAMVRDGWVRASVEGDSAPIEFLVEEESSVISRNRDPRIASETEPVP